MKELSARSVAAIRPRLSSTASRARELAGPDPIGQRGDAHGKPARRRCPGRERPLDLGQAVEHGGEERQNGFQVVVARRHTLARREGS